MTSKLDYPPFLSSGLHQVSVSDIEAMCVDRFDDSNLRPRIFSRLRAFIEAVTDTGVRGELWVDGSFITLKDEPNDVDLVLWIDGREPLSSVQVSRLDEIRSGELRERSRNNPYCDIYTARSTDYWRDYWRDLFGTGHNGMPKGIIQVTINGGVP